MRCWDCLAAAFLIFFGTAVWADSSWFDANHALFDCRNGDQAACETLAVAGRQVAGEFFEVADMPELSPETIAKIPELILARRASCRGGDQTACSEIGHLLLLSSPGKPPMESFDLLARACDRGEANACLEIDSISDWSNAQEDQAAAVAYYETQAAACEDGDMTACVTQARFNTRLKAITPDPEIWRDQFEAGCAANHARACQYLGNAFGYWGGAEYGVLHTEFRALFRDNYKISLDYNKKACDLGSSLGCWDAAAAYSLGDGVDEDVERSIEFDLRACLLGFVSACANVEDEWIYSVEVTEAQLQTTCAAGFAHACYLLAKKAATSLDVIIEICETGAPAACTDAARQLREAGRPDQAELYAFVACHNFHSEGCTVLGNIFKLDRGTPEDHVLAKGYHKIACDDFVAESCFSLADTYERGLAGPQDKEWARDIYSEVCYGMEESELTEEACKRADEFE